MKYLYLHELSPGIFHLDHRLTPEVRAMFASMASRLPDGGIQKRYMEVVKAVAEPLYNDAREVLVKKHSGDDVLEWNDGKVYSGWYEIAEERLTTYPLHPVVQRFFDQFVGQYGHSSIQEQVGDPAIYVEGISWFTAWLLFDSPLVKGQEFSTRALRHKDWPMAQEATTVTGEHRSVTPAGVRDEDGLILELIPGPIEQTVQPHPGLVALHNDWLAVYDAEVEWWKEHLSDPANRASLGIGDKEPFRPALDRARWALPGSIATGACYTSDLRERARVLMDGRTLGEGVPPVWDALVEAYCKAQPGIGPFAMRKVRDEAAREAHKTPAHLSELLQPITRSQVENGNFERLHGAMVEETGTGFDGPDEYERARAGTYMDPIMNEHIRVNVSFDCSIAVARDWHRHRTLYPWTLNVVLDERGRIMIATAYEAKSEFAKLKLPGLLNRSTTLYRNLLDAGDVQRAALALPLGTRVLTTGYGGMRDVVYALELRSTAHGANFEYKAQAEGALCLLGVKS
jgi:hypothetical protein